MIKICIQITVNKYEIRVEKDLSTLKSDQKSLSLVQTVLTRIWYFIHTTSTIEHIYIHILHFYYSFDLCFFGI